MHFAGSMLLSLGAALALAAVISALPEEVADFTLITPKPAIAPVDEIASSEQKKGIFDRIYKTKVINVPSKGLQLILLPWKCHHQSSCQKEPVCSTRGGTTSCTIRCYACHSCMQPKIIKKRLSNGKISVVRKSYIRTHRCGFCYGHSVCSVHGSGAPAPGCPSLPAPCKLLTTGRKLIKDREAEETHLGAPLL